MTSILLFDEAFLGHHAIWMEECLRAIRELAPDVKLSYAFPRPFTIDAHHIMWKEPVYHHVLRKVQAATGWPVLAAAKWRSLARLARGAKADRVLLMFGDEFLHPGFTPRVGFQWVPIYFHPRFLRGDPMEPPLVTLNADSCPYVYVLDAGVREALQNVLRKPVLKIPDFCPMERADDTPRCDALRAAANSRPIVGAIGPVTGHKNIGALIRVAKQRPEWHFLVAGLLFPKSLSPTEQALVDEARGMANVTCYFEYLPHEELNALTAMCNVQFAAYNQFLHSSNKLVRACEFQRPVVVADVGCMGDMVTQYRLGETCDPTNVASVDAALARCLKAERPAADWAGYEAANSLSALRQALSPLVADNVAQSVLSVASGVDAR